MYKELNAILKSFLLKKLEQPTPDNSTHKLEINLNLALSTLTHEMIRDVRLAIAEKIAEELLERVKDKLLSKIEMTKLLNEIRLLAVKGILK